jgi:enoyl-CoA hydratase/carnithine racemase
MIGKEVIIPGRYSLQQVRAVQFRARQPLPGAEDARQLDGHLRWLFQPHPSVSRPLRRRQSRQCAARAPVRDRRCGDHALPGGAARRLKAGDRVIVIGAAGGVGSFMVQVAKGMGAGAVIGIDINEEKLEFMKGYGADFTVNPRGKSAKEVKEAFKGFCKEKGIPSNYGWKIFEVTGTKPGQELALSLLSFTGKLIVVGYGTDETSYMLSKLMAFDAEIIGTWGCPPDKYPQRAGDVRRRPHPARPLRRDAADEPDRTGVRRGPPRQAQAARDPDPRFLKPLTTNSTRRNNMALEWLRRENDLKDHQLIDNSHFGGDAPTVIYEERPVLDDKGAAVAGLYSAWIWLNNPTQYNSYTTDMVKGVIAGMQRASSDRKIVAVVFTAVGDKAFCTGGNTAEYASYYSKRPNEYGEYMDLFNAMVDGILNCKKPVICRVNGMRVAGGQEIGMATDITVTSDLAVFGQAGPKHGSAPVGGSTDFLPWFLSMEDAMYNCISCETWSAYKMKSKGLVTKAVPVLKKDGQWVRNPLVRTDTYRR